MSTYSVQSANQATLATNKLIRNTYALLSMTLVFAGVMAFVGIVSGIGHGVALIADIVAIVMLWFVLPRTANGAAGIPVMFAITGLLGFGLGPVLNYYLSVNPSIVMMALGGTGVIFFGLSGYALTTRKDFSFMSGFLMVGGLVLMGGVILSLIFDLGVFRTAISAGFVIFASCAILWQTSAIIHGGETNYIRATVSLFVSIYNLFMSLLHLLTAFGGDD